MTAALPTTWPAALRGCAEVLLPVLSAVGAVWLLTLAVAG